MFIIKIISQSDTFSKLTFFNFIKIFHLRNCNSIAFELANYQFYDLEYFRASGLKKMVILVQALTHHLYYK